MTAYNRWFKRPLDVLGAAILLLVSLPIVVVVALSIPLMLGPGGTIYRQERVGRDGKPFTIYKFRSMLRDRRVADNPLYIGPERRTRHKCQEDPRHTRYGRFLRSTSLDELPQLLNIIRGEMSLVGPRPELIDVARRQGFANHPRHITRPGRQSIDHRRLPAESRLTAQVCQPARTGRRRRGSCRETRGIIRERDFCRGNLRRCGSPRIGNRSAC